MVHSLAASYITALFALHDGYQYFIFNTCLYTYPTSSFNPSPRLDLLHAALLHQSLVHVKAVKQKMRLVSPALLQTVKLGLFKVVLQDRLIHGMSTLVDDDPCPLAGTQASDVGEAVLCDDDVEVVLRLVDVGAHGHDAGDAVGVRLGRSRRGRVHDGVLGGAEEVGGTTEAVEHAGAHDAGGVGVGVDVDLDGRVHADDAETADNLGGVGDLLATEEELVVVRLPVVVEALEAVGGEADGGGRRKVETARVEEIEESILDDLCPDLEVLEIRLVETADNGVGDVSNARLQGKERRRQTAPGDLVLEEFD